MAKKKMITEIEVGVCGATWGYYAGCDCGYVDTIPVLVRKSEDITSFCMICEDCGKDAELIKGRWHKVFVKSKDTIFDAGIIYKRVFFERKLGAWIKSNKSPTDLRDE